ncbi:M56 family metallopeptidase [Vallitalea maricola]|uniref:Uncharacterized protein n=1 Tax=Vallitalea maricola TaxID=3074433 RepID=A0ACB5UFV7_9FIRM|nr:hypothetical protein AN2V17_09840 [Vallitalea sp. AN17-2]
MNEIVKLLISLSLSGSILALLFLTIKPLIKYKLSKIIQYIIWIIILLRFIVPISFQDSVMNRVFNNSESQIEIITPNNTTQINEADKNSIKPNVPQEVQKYKSKIAYNTGIGGKGLINIANKYILNIWILGVIIVFTKNIYSYITFLIHLKKSNKLVGDNENSMLSSLIDGISHVRFFRNPDVATPMLIGIIRPCIIIPDEEYTKIQLKNILLHETTHLKHFDIWVKWLTMIAASIHWFNPIMYFMKKEINNACELACDEAVIKNLSNEEKQAYGDTLIYVIAEHKYSNSILQATMCEEKKTLKERLISIMKYNKKSKIAIILSAILIVAVIIVSLLLGTGVIKGEDSPPNIYISAERQNTKEAITGSYSWKKGNEHIQVDSIDPNDFEYEFNNIVSAASEEQLIISTQKMKKDKKYDFTIEDISIYKDNQLMEMDMVEPNFINGNLYIQSPNEKGEYIYALTLKYNKGIVTYGFVVRVNMLTYDLESLSEYKTPYVGDSSKVSHIAGFLPPPEKTFMQHYISMETSEKPYSLTIFYELAPDLEYKGEWPIVTPDSIFETNSRINALVVFTMIDNLDEVTFAFRNSRSDGTLDQSKYNTSFTFSREVFEEYGDLTELGHNLDLLTDVLNDL